MAQPVGGVTADQLKPIEVGEEAVAVTPVGAGVTVVQFADEPITSRPLIMG
jgi:hypothetical protein